VDSNQTAQRRDAFLSHASADVEIAATIEQALEGAHLDALA
jgi:hypothetical protein